MFLKNILNEAIVFLVDTDDAGNSIIRIEEDEEVAIAVFDKYYDLLEQELNETPANWLWSHKRWK